MAGNHKLLLARFRFLGLLMFISSRTFGNDLPVFKLRTEAYKEFPCVVDVSNVCDFETQALVVDVFHIVGNEREM